MSECAWVRVRVLAQSFTDTYTDMQPVRPLNRFKFSFLSLAFNVFIFMFSFLFGSGFQSHLWVFLKSRDKINPIFTSFQIYIQYNVYKCIYTFLDTLFFFLSLLFYRIHFGFIWQAIQWNQMNKSQRSNWINRLLMHSILILGPLFSLTMFFSLFLLLVFVIHIHSLRRQEMAINFNFLEHILRSWFLLPIFVLSIASLTFCFNKINKNICKGSAGMWARMRWLGQLLGFLMKAKHCVISTEKKLRCYTLYIIYALCRSHEPIKEVHSSYTDQMELLHWIYWYFYLKHN